MYPVNIVATVDTIAALSQGTLIGNLYMTDDSWFSQNKGSFQLKTACYRGQSLSWTVRAVDVQSPAHIAGIALLPDPEGPFASGIVPHPDQYVQPNWLVWRGSLPAGIPLGLYRYRLAINVGSGRDSVMVINSPALDVVG